MLYAAMVFWLMVLVFAAYGTHQLWAGMMKPNVLNIVLLPGTLIAQAGRIVGMLVTGAQINNAALLTTADQSKTTKSKASQPKIPVIGPVLIALLPMLTCGFAIHMVVTTIGQNVLTLPTESTSNTLPLTFNSLWELLRSTIGVAEHVTGIVLSSDFRNWQTWLFVYLIICLTVRLAPMPGAHRGAIGAVLLIGVLISVVGRFAETSEGTIEGLWDLLNFSVGCLLCLLLLSLIVRGGVGLFRILTNQTKFK